MTPEVRRYERSSTGGGYQVGFRCGGQRFSGLPVATLSAGGCSFAAPEALVILLDRLEDGGSFEDLVLEHDDLPREAIRARMAYTLGRHPTMVGLEFLEMPPGFRETLMRQVRALVEHQRSMSGY